MKNLRLDPASMDDLLPFLRRKFFVPLNYPVCVQCLIVVNVNFISMSSVEVPLSSCLCTSFV